MIYLEDIVALILASAKDRKCVDSDEWISVVKRMVHLLSWRSRERVRAFNYEMACFGSATLEMDIPVVRKP